MKIPTPDEVRRAKAAAASRSASEQAARAAEEARAVQRRADEAARLRPTVYAQAVHGIESAMASNPAIGVIPLGLNIDDLGSDAVQPALDQIVQEFKDKGYREVGWGRYGGGETFIWYR
jgi:hypothetical protein